VLGSAARFTPGGQGANQAVAAARLGAQVRMVGCVGDDDLGRQLLASLRIDGVDVSLVRTISTVPTGLAMIAVDETGENTITVAPGANHEVGEDDVAAALHEPHDVLVICAEIPVPAIKLALTTMSQAPKVLNLAPAPADAAAIIKDAPDWLVVNESEAAAVLGRPVEGLADAARAAAELRAKGARHAVVTAGARGAALATPDENAVVTAFPVQAVDTVGAGDAFVGALAVALAAGIRQAGSLQAGSLQAGIRQAGFPQAGFSWTGTPQAEAVRAAAAAGATAATRPGAQAGMPRPADILLVTGFTWPRVGNISRHDGGG
jgi:ribokinase